MDEKHTFGNQWLHYLHINLLVSSPLRLFPASLKHESKSVMWHFWREAVCLQWDPRSPEWRFLLTTYRGSARMTTAAWKLTPGVGGREDLRRQASFIQVTEAACALTAGSLRCYRMSKMPLGEQWATILEWKGEVKQSLKTPDTMWPRLRWSVISRIM